MPLSFMLDRFKEYEENIAIIRDDISTSYKELLARTLYWKGELEKNIKQGTVVALKGDFTPETLALFFALTSHRCIIVPFLNVANPQQVEYNLEISEAEWLYEINDGDQCVIKRVSNVTKHPMLTELKESNEPGLILFTSGSSGVPKATVHNFSKLLEKFKEKKSTKRILNFLLFDHWGGLNTMLHILSGAGTLVSIPDRSADTVCHAIENYKIQLLPASPTFLNLLLLSGAQRRHDLSSLELITYGTEPMQENTLKVLNQTFPNVKLQQTYGLIELGVMRSKSKSPNSLWVKIGGEGYEWRVVDNILQIKANSAMLGYLNAPSPFTEDGWFITGDYVEQDGDYLKILGRKSEIINVGGEKVFPIEVENVIQSMENVAEATVFPQDHPITGKIVCAKVHLEEPEDKKAFKLRLKKYCNDRMATFKVPVKISISDETQINQRLKKNRTLNHVNPTG